MKMNMYQFLLFGFFAATLLVGGCGRKSSEQNDGEMVLNLVLNSRIKTFDPIHMRDEYTNMVANQMYEALYQSHYLKRPYAYEPLLAEEMPQISEDKLTYTIKIKKGIFFQDDECFKNGKGRELKAEDFVYVIKRLANIKNLSESWSSLDDKIVGLDEFREYTKNCKNAEEVDYSREIEGFRAIDDYTLVIKLKKPWPQFLASMLTDVSSSAVAKEAVDYYDEDFISHPVGTGPYMLKTWKRGSYIELIKNPNFRGELYPSEGEPSDAENRYLDDAGKIMPFADRIVWTIIEESQPAWLLFLQGKVDVKSVPKDNWDEVLTSTGELTEAMKQRNIHLKKFEDPSLFFVGFNLNDAVVGKNKPLRQAINRAIDREKFIKLFFGGRHRIAHGIFPPMMASYNPKIKEKGYARFDVDEAKQLVKEAEKVHGGVIPELTIAMQGTDTFYRQYGQFLKRSLNDIGLEVAIEFMDWPTYQQKVNNGQAQIFAGGWGVGIPDSQQFLSLFYSKYKAPGTNKFNYENPEYDKLYEKVVVMDESEERKELYRKMELMVLEDCPAAFTNHRVAYVLHHDWYLNYKPHVFQYGLGKYRRIDLAKRAGYPTLLKELQ
ncbi:MAG: ABC transporter substrate-binding protein [Phycisphaerales bacterium]|jgi:ABC-type transport system substrate-binding protein